MNISSYAKLDLRLSETNLLIEQLLSIMLLIFFTPFHRKDIKNATIVFNNSA